WDGTRWVNDDTGAIMRMAEATARGIYREAATVGDSDQARALGRHASYSLSAPRLKAMVELARSATGIGVTEDDLDTDPWLLNVQNGTLDLRTGDLQPNRPADLLTKLVPVEYRADVECPTWLAMLDRIMNGDQDLVS